MTQDPTAPAPATDADGSLRRAIETVARRAGIERDLDALAATMAWPWLICAPDSEACPRTWHRLARDAFLVEAARVWGMTIREMHPPDAARGLDALPEFEQHFDASYKPLIRRALEHDQPVIIAAPVDRTGGPVPSWRAIMPGEDAGLGPATGSPPPSAPPVQVYVVERVTAARPGNDQLWTTVATHARRALSGEIDDAYGIVTGPRACDRWMERLAAGRRCPACGEPPATCHRSLAEAIVEDHQGVLRFVTRDHEDLAAAHRELRSAMETAAGDVSSALAGESDPIPAVAHVRAALVRLRTALDARPATLAR